VTEQLIEARRAWAQALIRRCPSAAPYGSPEWLAEPEGTPAKIAACVRAAECWARDGDDLEDRLRLEVETERKAFKAAEDEDYQTRRNRHRADWRPRSASFKPDPVIDDDVAREFDEWADSQENRDDDGH